MARSTPLEKKMIQFSGIVYTADSSSVVPHATIVNISYGKKTTIANHKGYFSFVAHAGDTLLISCVGFKIKKVIIPSTNANNLVKIIKLNADIQLLREVRVVFPWSTVEEFNREFLSLGRTEDDWSITKKNIALTRIAILKEAAQTPVPTFYNESATPMYDHLYKVTAPPNNLLNPFAWAAFLERIFKGTEKNEKRDD